jgi:hypothetical protein
MTGTRLAISAAAHARRRTFHAKIAVFSIFFLAAIQIAGFRRPV